METIMYNGIKRSKRKQNETKGNEMKYKEIKLDKN